jgi:hypothetical protein
VDACSCWSSKLTLFQNARRQRIFELVFNQCRGAHEDYGCINIAKKYVEHASWSIMLGMPVDYDSSWLAS